MAVADLLTPSALRAATRTTYPTSPHMSPLPGVPLKIELLVNGNVELGDNSSWVSSSNAIADFYGSANVPFGVSVSIDGGAWHLASPGGAATLSQTIEFISGAGAVIDPTIFVRTGEAVNCAA